MDDNDLRTRPADPDRKLLTDICCTAVYIVEGGRFDASGERTAEENYAFIDGRELSANEAIDKAIAEYPALAGMNEYRAQGIEFDPSSFAAEIVER